MLRDLRVGWVSEWVGGIGLGAVDVESGLCVRVAAGVVSIIRACTGRRQTHKTKRCLTSFHPVHVEVFALGHNGLARVEEASDSASVIDLTILKECDG